MSHDGAETVLTVAGALKHTSGRATIPASGETRRVPMMPSPARPTAARDDQTVRPGASFLLSILFVGLSAATDSFVGFDSKPIDTGGTPVAGPNDHHVLVGVSHGDAGPGVSSPELGHYHFEAGADGAPDLFVFNADTSPDLSGSPDASKASSHLSDAPTPAGDNYQTDDGWAAVPLTVFSHGSGDSIVSLDLKQTANDGGYGAAGLGVKLSLVSSGNTASESSISDLSQYHATAGSGEISSPTPAVFTGFSGGGSGGVATGASGGDTYMTVGSAGGIVFDDTFTANCSQAYINCVVAAEDAITSLWTNPVTINVTFDAEAAGTGSGFLAENDFYYINVSYATLTSALAAHAFSSYAQSAVASLPTTDPNPAGGDDWSIPIAYARMLGLTNASAPFDDEVILNTSYNWSYGQDVTNAVEHELSEGGMGRVGGLGDQNSAWSTMDLFRFNAAGVRDYTDGRDGDTTYFSYNGGATLSSSAGLSFNNEFNSSGVQVNSGDTADFTQLDVFGTGRPGETFGYSQTDKEMMDVLGWDPAPVGPVLTITSTGGPTNQTAQTITGTINAANSGLTVFIFDGTTQIGTATPSANGSWSASVTLLSTQGAQSITAQAHDASGNVGTSSPVIYTLDTIPPALSITSTGILTNQTTQTISGTIDAADAGLTVSIYDGTTLLGTVTPAGNGTWSKQVTLLSTQGAQAITAQATDAAGNLGTSGTVTYTLDTIPPTLSITSTGILTNHTTQTISGTIDAADAGLTVSIYDGTTLLGTVTPAGNGTWSKQVTLLSTQGAQAITAQATDAAGNLGTSGTVTYTLDTIPPTLSITSTGILTNHTTQTISGTIDAADAGLTVSIYDGTTLLGTVTPAGNGTWSKQVTLLSTQGAQALTAQATDAAGNVGTSSPVTYTFDTIAPTLTIASSGGLTNQLTQTVSGTIDAADAGLTVSIFEGTTLIGTATPTANGNWSSAVTLLATQGALTLTAQATDAAGNVGTSNSIAYTLDLLAPTLVHETPVAVAAGTTVTITESQLQFNDNLSSHAQETYSVIAGPAQGTLFDNGSAASSFTQADVDNGLVSYHETGSSASSDSFTFKVTDAAGNQTATEQLQFQITPAVTVIQTDTGAYGTTSLTQVGNDYFVGPAGSSGTELKYAAAPLTVGEFGNWAPIGAVATANGYELAWKEIGVSAFQIATLDNNGNMVSWTPVIAGTSYTLESAESVFNQDLNGDGVIGPPSTVVQTDTGAFGTTSLVEVGNSYGLYTNGSGPVLQYAGAPVTIGEFGNWSPIGAVATANGYEIAWKETGADAYQLMMTDSNGNYVSATAVLPGSSYTVESAETVFNQDLNGDGTIGPLGTVIQTDTGAYGSTSLTEVGNSYALNNASGSGPLLTYAGAPVTAGEFGPWAPIGAVATASGYEVAWKETGVSEYQVSIVDNSGNMVSSTPLVSGTSYTLELAETVFNQDLNGDGTIGPLGIVIQTDTSAYGSTSLTEVGNSYALNNASGSGPLLTYAGAPVTTGEFGDWAPIGAVATASGYEVAWHETNTSNYQLSTVDNQGNMVSSTAVIAGTSYTLELAETVFNQDLNGDGTIGPAGTVIQTDTSVYGSTSLTQVGNSYALDNASGSGPLLQYAGAPVTVDEFGPWAPIGAVATASGYEVAWKETGASEFQISNVDSNGNMGTSTAVVSGTNSIVESAELVFNQDLNGDGTIGPPPNNGGAALAQAAAVSIGGASHDAFIFKPGLGADLGADATAGGAASWHPSALDHVSAAPGISELQALLAEAQHEHALFQFANGGHDGAIPPADPHATHFVAHQPLVG